MALSDEVTARYASARLIQLTNPGDQTATTVDTTFLGKAATDVEADFEIIAGVAYDNSEARHVSVGVEGVIAKLYQRGEAAGGDADARHSAYLDRLAQLAKVTGRNRIIPTTSSVLTPTSERTTTSEVVPPEFDWPNFDDLIPAPPD